MLNNGEANSKKRNFDNYFNTHNNYTASKIAL